jgi:hypothetical protein
MPWCGEQPSRPRRFRGASSVNIARFDTAEFPGGSTGRLKINYRSAEEIVDTFVAFAAHDMKAAGEADVTLTAERGPSGIKPEHRAVAMAPDEMAAIAEAIEAHRVAGVSYREGASEIIVRPDEVLTSSDGRRYIRAVRTGHATSKELETVAAAVFTLAAYEAFPGCTVEFVHLGDATVRPIEMSEKVLGRRRTTTAEMIAEIRAGRFPREESSRTCPRCPAFFICGPAPDGMLEKKFAS